MAGKENLLQTDVPFAPFSGYQLRLASNTMMHELGEILRQHSLTVVEATVLLFVARNEGCLQRLLGGKLNIASANLTPMLSKLEKRQFIRREPIDGRSKGLFLTEPGNELASNVWKDMVVFEKALLERIPASLRGAFMEALTYLSK